MFEHMGHTCFLVLLEDADVASAEHLQQALHERSGPWANELNRDVAPIAFIAGAVAKALAPKEAALRAESATTPWLTGTALQQAYRERNFDFLDMIWTQEAATVAPTPRAG